jgi:hypothetical protein
VHAQHRGPVIVIESPFLGRAPYIERRGLRALWRRLRGKRTLIDPQTYARIGSDAAFQMAIFAMRVSRPTGGGSGAGNLASRCNCFGSRARRFCSSAKSRAMPRCAAPTFGALACRRAR